VSEQQVIEDPVLGQRLSFHRTADPDGGEVLRIDTWVDPGGGTSPHIHPVIEERFEILAGHPSFLAGRKWRSTAPGETVVVPPGLRHGYRNRTDDVVHMVVYVRPPSTLQGFLEDAAAMSRAGKVTRRGSFPKGLSALLQGAVMAHYHREMVVLLFPPTPPPFLQRLLLPILARLGERRGYRAGELTQSDL
jgi:quercetin dioxygenase-like cupin family protein